MTTSCKSSMVQLSISSPSSPFFSLKKSTNLFTSISFLSNIFSLKNCCFASDDESAICFLN